MRARVNPRVNRDLPQQEMPADTRSEDPGRTLSMVDVMTSPGWVEVVVDNLRHRCRTIERKLAVDRNLQPVEIQRLQHHHELMEQILTDPKEFFSFDPLGEL